MGISLTRPIVLAVAFTALTAASAWSILNGIADHWARQGTAAAMEKAVALTPWQ